MKSATNQTNIASGVPITQIYKQFQNDNRSVKTTQPNPPNPNFLSTKPVESTALSLQRINHVHSSNSFPASMLRVGYGVANNIFEKDLQNASCFLVD
ncbi:hypothetical protein L1987_29744 [Smallanthus sonchifolius]|uniref:Uncharacterized protein n=1 Tax=Smallanthus sonchifolius TaxID=185202 RepID=A0ACB9I2N4_9ASTR|nr:hypothetical protein L1987_29744 [Smallanthus sonchifolius]